MNTSVAYTTLDALPVGGRAVVSVVEGEGSFRRRLLELGFLPGTEVVRTGQAPLGDPLTILVRGAVLCLREVDARRIVCRAVGAMVAPVAVAGSVIEGAPALVAGGPK